MASNQHSEERSSQSRHSFGLSPPTLPHFSLRRIFTPNGGSSKNQGTNGSWRQRFRILTSSDQPNDGARSDTGVNLYPSTNTEMRASSSSKHQKSSSKSKSVTRTLSVRSSSSIGKQECAMCLQPYTDENAKILTNCDHKFGVECLWRYITTEVTEGRANLSCPEPSCQAKLHPADVAAIVGINSQMYRKYEEFLLRRCLMADPDTRWCPAPDCGFAVIASGCAECPQLKCDRPGCGTSFCYHCKQIWHPNLTCEVARVRRTPGEFGAVSSDLVNKDDIKPCPRCGVFILKADDGSCNHMSCRLCGAEFCWLCMKLVTDVHYLSPSGCTFWGKKRWSRKKKLFWQLGLLAGAPVGIVLLTAIAIPAIMAGFPIWTGRKIRQKHRNDRPATRNAAIAGGVVGATIAAPAIAAAAVGVGVPVLLAYVYGVVPVSLCRSGSVGAKESKKDQEHSNKRNAADVDAIMAAMNSSTSPVIPGDHVQIYPDKSSNLAMAGTISVVSVEAMINGDSSSQADHDPGSWHLSVDTAGCGESEERVTLDHFHLPRQIILCDKPSQGDDSQTEATRCAISINDPSLAGSIDSSSAARRLMVRSGHGASASFESIGASCEGHSEDHFSGVIQLDSVSASVRGLTGSVTKLPAQSGNVNVTGSELQSEASKTPSPLPVDIANVRPSLRCEVLCHEVPSSP